MSFQRTVEFSDITPDELAEMFTDMTGDMQADFFAAIKPIADKWPGAGWCQQSCDIARWIDDDGRAIIQKLAEHVLNYEEKP